MITAVCLDYQKVFSKVLQQLIFHETRAKVIIQINNWLKDKKQCVGVNGQFSEWVVTCGVQPSSAFINELEKRSEEENDNMPMTQSDSGE